MSLIRSLFAAALLACAGATSPHARRDDSAAACGFVNPKSGSRALKTVHKLQKSEVDLSQRDSDRIEITVNLHAGLPKNASSSLASVPQLHRQFDVLKDEYEPYGIDFKLGNVTRTLDDNLTRLTLKYDEEEDLSGSSPAIEAFWKKQRTGDYKTLNIFIYQQMDNALGICNFPDEDRTESTYYLDACHVVADSLPGSGSKGVWNAGGSAVHEVGHWFGLFHVWTGSCTDDGDQVSDTAQQKDPSIEGCEKKQDSCPGKPGLDNSHNFMDYAGDLCATEFTMGQQARMHNVFNTIRAKK